MLVKLLQRNNLFSGAKIKKVCPRLSLGMAAKMMLIIINLYILWQDHFFASLAHIKVLILFVKMAQKSCSFLCIDNVKSEMWTAFGERDVAIGDVK